VKIIYNISVLKKHNQVITFETSKKNYKKLLHPYGLTISAHLDNFNQNIFTSKSMEITEGVKIPGAKEEKVKNTVHFVGV
jgi:hypothetical protein